MAARAVINRKTSMKTKTLNQILETVIKNDPALAGFKPSELSEAAKARVAVCLAAGSLDEHEPEELEMLGRWSAKHWEKATFEARQGECCYYVFADGSLYFRSSGDSEVWVNASDFATDRIIPSYDSTDRKLDEMDSALLNHLGGHFSDFVSDRECIAKAEGK